MLQINPQTMVAIASDRGWLHTRGIRAGSINFAAMAEGLGIAQTTIQRAYDGGAQAGPVLAEKLRTVSGRSFDEILEVVPDAAEAVMVA